jgi:hypothetical protein
LPTLAKIRAGVGLAPTRHELNETPDEKILRSNFLDQIVANVPEVSEHKFSFYLHKVIPQAVFGTEEEYFAKEPFTSFENID